MKKITGKILVGYMEEKKGLWNYRIGSMENKAIYGHGFPTRKDALKSAESQKVAKDSQIIWNDTY